MTFKLRPYPEYKGSSLPWLGDIPSKWRVLRGKGVFTRVDVRSKTGNEELLTVSARYGVLPRRERSVTMFKAASYVGHKLCWPGDLVINSLWAWAGGLGFARQHGIVSSAYGVYRPRTEYSKMFPYFDSLFRSKCYDWELTVRSKGIWTSRLQMTDLSFLDMPVLLPPEEEAMQIANFLDLVNRRITRVVRAKQELIKLLNEQKQAIIHRCVTGGLLPNVRLKPSGVDWLGNVPDHWELRPLKYLSSRIQNGATPPTDVRIYYEPGSVPWYGPSSIGDAVEVGAPVRLLNPLAFRDGKARLINSPALMIVVIGATAGRIGLLNSAGSSNQQITAFELRTKNADPLFIAYQLKQAEPWLRGGASSATIPIINSTKLNRSLVAYPPLAEQQAILHELRLRLVPFEASTSRAYRTIKLLQEYRARLITDVVTGKLDVRGIEVPTLDDEPELTLDSTDDIEAEALDETEGAVYADD